MATGKRSRGRAPTVAAKPSRARGPRAARLASAPILREFSPGRFLNVEPNVWGVRVGPDWLGPDATPRYVPIPVLKIMREDPQLSLGLAAFRGPFFGIDYTLEGGRPEVQAFVRKAFLERPVFKKTLRSLLNCIDFGFNPHELLWDIQDVTSDASDAGLAPMSKLAAYVIREAKDIDPERVEILVDQKDRLAGYRVDGRVVIPREKCLHVADDMEYQRHRGRGKLRRAFNPWVFASYIHQFQNRYMERKVDPPYKGYAPTTPRSDPKTPAGTPPVYPHDVLRDILIDVRGSGVIVLPSEFDPKTGKPLWDATEIGTGGRAELYLPTLQYYQTLKMRGLGIPDEVAETGDDGGSYAKSAVSLNVFFDTLEALKEVTILCALNEGVIEPLVRFNYGDAEAAPRVVAPSFSREHQDLLVDVLRMALADPENMAKLDLPKMFEIANLPKNGKASAARAPGSGGEGGSPATLPQPKPLPKPTPMGEHSVAPSVPQAGPKAAAAASRVELASADSCGVFIRVPDDLASEFPPRAEDPSPPHMTLLYVGKVPRTEFDRLVATVADVARGDAPFTVEMTDYGEFTNRSGQTIAHMIPRGDQIAALHAQLRAAVASAGFDVEHHPGVFKPHVTLDYMEPGQHYEGARPSGSWTVRSLEVWGWGERRAVPLGGRAAAARVEAASSTPDVHVHITNQVAAPKAPSVTVKPSFTVEAAAPPDVNVTVEAPAPPDVRVNVQPTPITVAAPNVTVEAPSMSRRDVKILRDARGEITGAVVKPEP
jgi:2'-5' RNA ligase